MFAKLRLCKNKVDLNLIWNEITFGKLCKRGQIRLRHNELKELEAVMSSRVDVRVGT